MSKMDNLRAMREARYERSSGQAEKKSAARPKMAPVAPVAPVAPPVGAAGPEDQADDGLCGHRAISGRTCTRERGHSAKSHRYS
jgi:hypothetical protein